VPHTPDIEFSYWPVVRFFRTGKFAFQYGFSVSKLSKKPYWEMFLRTSRHPSRNPIGTGMNSEFAEGLSLTARAASAKRARR
jgi:hypothetical protein